jgi:hypothetical protein
VELWYLSGLAPQDRGYSPLIYQIGLVAVAFGIVINAAWFAGIRNCPIGRQVSF